MMRFLSSLFGSGSGRTLSAFEYTRQVAEALRQAGTGRNVEMVTLLELKVQRLAPWMEDDHFPALHDAYRRYVETPGPQETAAKEQAGEILKTLLQAEADLLDRERILPVLQPASFMETIRRQNQGQRRGSDFNPVQEPVNDELSLYYVVRRSAEEAYVLEKTYLPAEMDLASLREPAIANLRLRLVGVTREATDGIWRFSAQEGNVTSLSLLDHPIWAEVQAETTGQVVLALPIQGMLMAADSANDPGMQQLRRIAAETHAKGEGPLLSPRLFIRRAGRLELFE